MKKKVLFQARWLLCSLLAVFLTTNVWADKITRIANIESGKTYYIGATTSNTDYYLSVSGSTASSSVIAGTAVTDKTSAATFVFTQDGDNWTIKFADSDNYLSLSNSKNNGKVIVNTTANWTISNHASKELLVLACGNTYALEKNNSGTQFGSYAKTQTDVWLEEVPSGSGEGGDSPTPGTITVTPTAVNATMAETTDEIAVSYTGIGNMDQVEALSLYNDEEHTSAFTGDWLLADWNADKSKIDYIISANTGAARTAYIYIQAMDDETNIFRQDRIYYQRLGWWWTKHYY